MKKIVMIITSLSCGGAETVLYELTKKLSKYDLDLHIISLSGKGVIYEKIKKLDIPISVVSNKSGPLIVFSFIKLFFLLRKIKPEVVHTWMYHADLFGGMIAKLANVDKIVWSLHNTNLDKDKTKLTTRLVVKTCSLVSSWLPSYIVSCSFQSSLVHIEIGYPKEKITVIPNGFNLSEYYPRPGARQLILSELNIPKNSFLVGLMARFDPVKNHIGLIESAATLCKNNSNIYFIFAGQGVDSSNKYLTSIIDDLNLNSKIHMLGYRSDMPYLISSLDLLVSSSHGEAFPLVVGEAMSCEVPCVVTDVGDSSYLVGNTGKVVKADDIDDLANAIEYMFQMKTEDRQYLGKIARHRIIENFDITIIAKQYKKLYENVVSKDI